MSGLSTAFHRTNTKDYEGYGLADVQTLREIVCKEKKTNVCCHCIVYLMVPMLKSNTKPQFSGRTTR